MVSSRVGHSLDRYILAVYRFICGNRPIDPNIITIIGTIFGFISASCIVFEHLLLGAIALLVSGFLDMSDGALARSMGRITVFGGFLDSVLDRYTDLLVTGSILYFFMSHGSICYASITFIAVVGTAIIPYARARAEAAGVPCRSGLLERPERTILLIVGLFVPLLLPFIVVVLAVLTHITVIQRVLYVMKKIKE